MGPESTYATPWSHARPNHASEAPRQALFLSSKKCPVIPVLSPFYVYFFSFFFFQAEDGIRDLTVTGVQTCALPISLDLLLDGLKVGERAAQPALGHVERPAALRLRLEDVLELFLGADEQDVLTLQHHPAEQLLRGLDLPERLLEVDDVDPRPLGDNEPAHLGIPAARLMAEMDARFQQILQLRLRHALPFVGSIRRRRHLRCNPAGGPSTGS